MRNKPIAFLTSWLPSPSSLLKLPIDDDDEEEDDDDDEDEDEDDDDDDDDNDDNDDDDDDDDDDGGGGGGGMEEFGFGVVDDVGTRTQQIQLLESRLCKCLLPRMIALVR